jgi:hypothetical protein
LRENNELKKAADAFLRQPPKFADENLREKSSKTQTLRQIGEFAAHMYL